MRRTAPALVTGDTCHEREGGTLETGRVCVNSKAEPSSYGDDLLAPQEKRHSGSFICPIKPKGWQSRFR